MASIEPRTKSDGTTTYRARITLKGFPRISESFATRRAAERWAAKTETAMHEGLYRPGDGSEERTFGEMIDRFIADELGPDTWLAACKTLRNKILYPLTLLAISRGARRSELMNLAWRRVDLERGLIAFDVTKVRGYETAKPALDVSAAGRSQPQ